MAGQPAYGQQPGQYPGGGYGASGYDQGYGYNYGYDQGYPGAGAGEGFGEDKTLRNKMITAGLIGALAASLLGGLLWLIFGRDSSPSSQPADSSATGAPTDDSQTGGSTSGDPVSASGACQSLVQELTAGDQPTDVAVRLQELATNTNAATNAEFFSALEVDLAPARDSYQQECLADVASGREPSTYRSFVTSFDRAVSDGATLGTQIAATNTVDPAQARTLTDDAAQLQQAAAALPTSSSSSSSQAGDGNVTAQNDPFATSSPTTPVDPFASPGSTVDPFASPTPTPTPPVDALAGVPSPTPTSQPDDAALAAADNAADQEARAKAGAGAK